MPKVYNKHHINAPANAVYIGRGSKWGNPFVIGKDGSREDVIAKFKAHISSSESLMSEAKNELAGKDLLCFCSPKACHGDVLLDIALSYKK